MKKVKTAIFTIAAFFTLSGCAAGRTSTFPPRQNAVYVSRDGGLYTAILQNYDESSDTGYDAQELKAMAQKEAAEYNSTYGSGQGQDPVSVAECTVEQGTASVIYQYATPEDLCRFTQISQDAYNHPDSLEVTTNSERLAEETPWEEGAWIDAEKNSTAALETVMKKKDLPMVVVSGAVTLQTEGRILYYSGAVNLKDEYTVQVTEGTAYVVFR